MNEEKYVITKDSFKFVHSDEATLHDEKLSTKRVGFFKDALRRFRKNKGSVVAASIIFLLILFAIFAPIISKHGLDDRDLMYKDRAPLARGMETSLFWDGGKTQTISAAQYRYYQSIGKDTGYNPITKVFKVSEDGLSYKVRVNTYFQIGAYWATIEQAEYEKILAFQEETGLQVILPYVRYQALGNGGSRDIPAGQETSQMKEDGKKRKNTDANICYYYSAKGLPIVEKGSFVYAYALQSDSGLFHDYTGLRVDSDPAKNNPSAVGYAYVMDNGGALEVRLNYYNYYQFQRGETPQYLFGTDTFGKDIFHALGKGARFSFILAIIVSVVNFTLGTIYGAIEGYYGGAADMIMERISDILSGVPLMIVVTLFNLHLAQKVGVIPAFILAFIATGWIGMAGLVRKQFYRFKGQEYVLASRTLGANDFRIMFKHIYPNSLGTIVTRTVLIIPGVIGSETMLTYLGIINLSGEKLTSIGALMASANGSFDSYPHELFFPALFLSLLLICFNLFGNGLRDAFNPALRGADE